ncbi:MAG: hypothetical protein ACXW5U_09060 [Thermoanaerobaculia bacterium]
MPKTCLARVDAATGAVTRGATIDGANAVIASNGSGYVVVAGQGDSLSTGRITGIAVRADGSVGGEPFTIATNAYMPEIASNGSDYLVVFRIFKINPYLDAVLVSDRAVIGTQQRLTIAEPSYGATVASDGDGFLVAWWQNRRVDSVTGSVSEVLASRVSADGRASEPRAVLGESAWEPALVWTGSEYLLTYTDSGTTNPPPNGWWDSVGARRATVAASPSRILSAINCGP